LLRERLAGNRRCCPNALIDWIDENNCVRVIDAFVDLLDLAELSFLLSRQRLAGPPTIPWFC
jgi:hypothetical protein